MGYNKMIHASCQQGWNESRLDIPLLQGAAAGDDTPTIPLVVKCSLLVAMIDQQHKITAVMKLPIH
jgi:hypothetical protein